MNIDIEMMKHTVLYFLFILLLVAGCSEQGKNDLSVLYVGGSPDIRATVSENILEESVRERMASFEQLLKHYFKTVAVVHARDYLPEMSDNYDVTIMDGTPRELAPAYTLKNYKGVQITRSHARYLPDDFDRPMIFIADASDMVGRRLGVKMDWFCLCLDAHAYGMRSEHPIFHGPFPVNMSLKLQPTPSAAIENSYASTTPVPDSVLMWRVQTDGYMTNEQFRSGMISKFGGFEDSPDCEYISGGVSAKDFNAVAIGRHGNFLLWGFSASPRYMTEEAQAVFANTVVYMAKFAGCTPIVRKYFDTFARSYLFIQKHFLARTTWEKFAKRDSIYYAEMAVRRNAALEKQKKGEELTDEEKIAARFKPMKAKSYPEHLAYYEPELFKRFGGNEQAYMDYYDQNYDYFYMGNGEIEIDEDAKAWGIPNNDLRLLDKAISCLEKNVDTERAQRLLHRYTLCRFATPHEWREWYETYKSKMFFTESGGWYFMVNSEDKNIPGNDYSTMWEKVTKVYEQPEAKEGQTDDKNPVHTEMYIEQAGKDTKVLAVKMHIHPGFHAYAQVASSDPYLQTTLKFVLPDGWKEDGEIDYPAFKKYNEAGTLIYEDEIIFRQKIKGNGKGKAKCTIEYQCCNDQICMPPVKEELSVGVE